MASLPPITNNPDIRFLGRLLGDVIRAYDGEALFRRIEYIRAASVENYGAQRGEIGWILEDNGPMRSIADVIESKVTRTYRIYERSIAAPDATTALAA